MTFKTKLASVFLAASALISASVMTACGGKAPQKSKLEHVYDYTAVSLKRSIVENGGIDSCTYSGGRIYFSTYGENSEGMWEQQLMSVAEDGSDLKTYKMSRIYDGSNIGNTLIAGDRIWYLENKWNWDEATQTSSAEFAIHIMDAEGKELGSFDISKETTDKSGEVYGIDRMVAAGDKIFCTSGKKILVISESGVEKAVEINISGWLNSIFADKSGNLWAVYYEETGNSGSQKCRKLDINTGALTDDASLPSAVTNNIYNANSSKDYDICYSTNTAFYGCNFGDAEPTEICNWMNSDISANYIQNAMMLDDGRLFVAPEIWSQMNETSGDTVEAFYICTKRPDDKNVEKFILSLGCVYLDGNIRTAVSKFNRDSDEYRITIKDYSIYSTEEDWQASYTRLNQDIISGNAPDIILVTEQMPYSSYAAKGVFADLNDLLDKDPEIKREDYLENILNATSMNGKLYSIIPTFSVTTLACKASLVRKALGTDDITGVNMEEFNKILAALPGARAFSTSGRDDFLNTLTSSLTDMYIDQETGKCSFDSPDFIAMLEFVKSLPEKSVYDTIDWDDYDESIWNDIDMMFVNDEAVFSSNYLSQYSSYWQQKMGQFGGDMIYVGYPCETRDGARINANMELAVSGTSKFKEQAWQFVRYFLLDDYQDSMQWQLPIKKSILEKRAQEALNPPKEGDEGYYYGMDNYYLGGQEIKIGSIDQAGVDYVNKYIASIQKYNRPDEKIQTIITEETGAFFSGIKSAEECAKLIQNRVQTYVSEQR